MDQDGQESEKGYAMYVRNLDLDVVCTPDPFVDELYANGVVSSGLIGSVPYEVIRFSDITPFILNDILHNRSKKLCRYNGQ